MAMENKIGEGDLTARLDMSYCRYKGDPVLVRVVGNKLHLYRPSQQRAEPLAKISPYDKDFDVESLPLGYVSHKGRVYYLSRAPRRKYVQGVNATSLNMASIPESPVANADAQAGRGNNREGILATEGFENMVLGKYPSVDEVLSQLNKVDEIREEALSRNIAVVKNSLGIINVYFKNELVGWIAPKSTIVHVPTNDMGWVVSMYLRDLTWQVD